MSESILVAGPWLGEFGYELFRWQGHLRALSREYDRVVVASRPGHDVLYRDFAEFIPYDSDPNPCEGRYGSVLDLEPMKIIERVFGHIPYYRVQHPWDAFQHTDPAEYIEFGRYPATAVVPYELIFHARGIQVPDAKDMVKDHAAWKQSRNWSLEKWEELTTWFNDYGYEMACIGDPRSAYKLPYCHDLRGINLGDLANTLNAGGWIIGPSSGPMHFASLCRCPQLVWGTSHLRPRYEELWNPLGTFVHLHECDEQWDPTVDEIKDTFIRLHEG